MILYIWATIEELLWVEPIDGGDSLEEVRDALLQLAVSRVRRQRLDP